MSAAAALEMPYFADLYDPNDCPTRDTPVDWGFEVAETTEDIKREVYRLTAAAHPQMLQRDEPWFVARGIPLPVLP